MNFEDVIDKVLAREGGYVDNPTDKGGPTMYGITGLVARANGYMGAMKDLPMSLARQIYRNRYIITPAFDKIALVDEAVAFKLIDAGVNMGPATVGPYFQRWLNGFNADGSHYADVFVDGRIGDVTVASFRAYMRWRGAQGSAVMVEAIGCLQGAHYLDITEHDKTQREFLYGWMVNRVLGTQGAKA